MFLLVLMSRISHKLHAWILRGEGTGGLIPSPKKSQNIGFLSNTGPDPLKNHNATESAFNLGHHRHASRQNTIQMWFCWRADDGLLILEFGSSPPS